MKQAQEHVKRACGKLYTVDVYVKFIYVEFFVKTM